MKRRDFLKNLGSGALAASALSLTPVSSLLASPAPDQAYDLVAVKNGEPAVMFDKAIASLGGMGTYVKKGQTVVLKPNIGWDAVPERAANTNPLLVKRIIEHCINAGAKAVYVFDNTCDNWQKCYTNSGIEKAVKDAGGTIINGKIESDYQTVQIPKGKKLKTAKVNKYILQSNVFINVPVLKSHGGAKLTIAMKNLMGIVWDRGFWHSNDLHQCIADFCTWKKPTLNVVDAYRVMKTNGPRGVSTADVVTMKSLLVSTDIVAVDAAATKLFGMEPDDIPYIVHAHTMKIGNKSLENRNINRIIL